MKEQTRRRGDAVMRKRGDAERLRRGDADRLKMVTMRLEHGEVRVSELLLRRVAEALGEVA